MLQGQLALIDFLVKDGVVVTGGTGDEKPIGLGLVKLSGEFGEDLDWEGTVNNKGGTGIVIGEKTIAGSSWHLYE